ncbi:phosphate ABC transporter permease PstA [Moraxella osloensis]|jgi:phosphate transport system permease protein|uniref:Phosphate transport system permease protein PstA n=1 Tax=Enhydrobacter aerosaccus TaxID=225324 RepID=A0ABR5IN72_9HYPH|nr:MULTISPECIES: phosphate ABC transporter permease PstA [Pseudomonadota]ATQ85708.1 phosphate ABC transporter, permease protein PstA [Moraxella osloensis]KND22503.1 phosphate transporter [Enhydrobacter aerosaccus]MBL7667991.1 phosphate ABC transporter permease PstA [Moraxella osloensis]MDI4480488.1 phosphate ABC transporter permease PstA [Moraxella osloensis]OBX56803.1 phosphate ABC transporter, permease protein PstA [Moraxella osloensis]
MTTINMNRNNAIYKRRRLSNALGLVFAGLSIVFGLTFLGLILFKLFLSGSHALLTMPIFTQDTPSPNEIGGLRNAIIGSIMVTGLGLVVGTPIGVMAGIYLAEFAENSWLGKVTRFMNDILLSAPSIVIGLFIFALMVQGRNFSGWAGAMALALLVIPVVVRTTENMLRLIPNTLREAAYALGTPKWKLVTSVTLRAAKTGVLTGILLAFARISGETAPLLFTALNNQFFSTDMGQPIANLPNVIYQYASQPYPISNQLAWAGALLITLAVLTLNILARALSGKEQSSH